MRIDTDVEHIAPMMLKTLSMLSTPIATPIITRYKPIVYKIKCNLAFFLRSYNFIAVFMYELISSTSSPRAFLCLWSSFFIKTNLINAMKLFLQPKNMMGKAKNIEIRKKKLMAK